VPTAVKAKTLFIIRVFWAMTPFVAKLLVAILGVTLKAA
jgi:hypothetical protein